MKLHNRIYRSLTQEPFHTQKIGEKEVGFYYLNDTQHLAQYVQKGRFYVWTSDGTNYRLVIEKGYYEKVSYFFSEEINTIWINFLDEIGVISKKMSRMFLIGSLVIAILIVVASILLEFQQYGVFIALTVVLIANMVHSSRLNKIIKEKNYNAQVAIRDLLTEPGFEKLILDQEEYYKEYFAFDEEELEEELEDEENLIATAAAIIEESEALELEDEVEELLEEELEEEIVEELIEEEIIEKVIVEEVVAEEKPVPAKKPAAKKPAKKSKNNKVDYNTLTVPQLRKLAKNLELTGYSTMRKAELVALITKNR
ncbi:MAG TPA: Rho termination factor N-terminal domain-containing protein [Haploplasma sp.]|nr:Rho termination factor N-terminal domain-containing protein [Haploplasma sp.]